MIDINHEGKIYSTISFSLRFNQIAAFIKVCFNDMKIFRKMTEDQTELIRKNRNTDLIIFSDTGNQNLNITPKISQISILF